MTLDGFPIVLDDEMIFSVCSCYYKRAGFVSNQQAKLALFGDALYRFNIQFPSRIRYLASQIPPIYGYNSLFLTENTTLYPLYRLYVGSNTAGIILSGMLESLKEGDGIVLQMPRHGTIAAPTSIRICTDCVQEDKKGIGKRAYFKRSHQIPGINFCWKHGVPLVDTNIKVNGLRRFVSADEAEPQTVSQDTSLDKYRGRATRLAEDAHWILTQKNLQLTIEELRERYRIAFSNNGWLPQGNSHIRVAKLLKEFNAYYSTEFLTTIGCDIRSGIHPWIDNVYSEQLSSCHPVKHLLLIQFLGYKAEEFFTFPLPHSEGNPFGDGPWFCLNPVCKNYKMRVINSFVLKWEHNAKRNRGIFTCECGYSYVRYPTSAASNTIDHYDQVENRGAIWDTKLTELWHSKMPTSNQMKLLGLNSRGSYYRQVDRLGLRGSSGGANNVPTNPVVERDKKTEYRSALLQARKEYPSATRSELETLLGAKYRWLRQDNIEWFEANTPSRRSPGIFKDWVALDQPLAERIALLGEHYRNLPIVYEWMNRSFLLKEANWNNCFANRQKRLMPKTEQMLLKYAETHDQYYVRVLLWAEKTFKADDTVPSKSQLFARDHLTYNSHNRQSSVVKATIVEILSRLNANIVASS